MKTLNLFIAQQCDQTSEATELEQCIASGQVSAAQVEAHRSAGDFARLATPIPTTPKAGDVFVCTFLGPCVAVAATNSSLVQAAQAVLERWDSTAWAWCTNGQTANLMHNLRLALGKTA